MITVPVLARTTTINRLNAAGKQIDLVTTHGQSTPVLVTKGLYSLQRNKFTYCIAAPGQPRPSSISTSSGDGRTLVVLKRM